MNESKTIDIALTLNGQYIFTLVRPEGEPWPKLTTSQGEVYLIKRKYLGQGNYGAPFLAEAPPEESSHD